MAKIAKILNKSRNITDKLVKNLNNYGTEELIEICVDQNKTAAICEEACSFEKKVARK